MSDAISTPFDPIPVGKTDARPADPKAEVVGPPAPAFGSAGADPAAPAAPPKRPAKTAWVAEVLRLAAKPTRGKKVAAAGLLSLVGGAGLASVLLPKRPAAVVADESRELAKAEDTSGLPPPPTAEPPKAEPAKGEAPPVLPTTLTFADPPADKPVPLPQPVIADPAKPTADLPHPKLVAGPVQPVADIPPPKVELDPPGKLDFGAKATDDPTKKSVEPAIPQPTLSQEKPGGGLVVPAPILPPPDTKPAELPPPKVDAKLTQAGGTDSPPPQPPAKPAEVSPGLDLGNLTLPTPPAADPKPPEIKIDPLPVTVPAATVPPPMLAVPPPAKTDPPKPADPPKPPAFETPPPKPAEVKPTAVKPVDPPKPVEGPPAAKPLDVPKLVDVPPAKPLDVPAFPPKPAEVPPPAPLPPVGRPTPPDPAVTRASIASNAQTTFDVDLHDVRTGDTFAAVSRKHLGDDRYAEAIRLFNNGRTLAEMQTVEIPPIHVLRQRFPQAIGGRPAEATPAAGPRGPFKSFTVPPGGITLKGIARQAFGDDQQWPRVWDLNPSFKPDAVLADGTEVRLPTDARIGR